MYPNLVGGATKTFPTVILLKSHIDRHSGCSDNNAAITGLALNTGQNGNEYKNCKISLCISLRGAG